jgi:hypothetical protein
MRILVFLTAFFTLLLTVSLQAQNKNYRLGALFYMDYSAYRWDQRPAEASLPERTTPYSLGQVLNVVPGVYGGFWAGDVRWALLSLEGGMSYFPLSLDLSEQTEPKSWGTLGFPILFKLNWLLDSSYRQEGRRVNFKSFIFAGYGREWVLAGLIQPEGAAATLTHQLHIVELGAGNTMDGFSLMTFFRFGWERNGAYMANVGLKFGWDGF